jgi:CBS domain containing-hemolysin-like protein
VARAEAEARGAGWVLLIDRDETPLGWIRTSELGSRPLIAENVDSSSPFVHYETTLRDALSMLLASEVQTAVVVDDRGRYLNILTFDELGLAFRSEPEKQPATVA